METYDYVILEIGKVIIINEENKKTFLIEEEGKRRPLTDSEQQYIDNIFKSKYGYVVEDNIIKGLVDSNTNFKEKQTWIDILSAIEKSIPENSRENYYKNIQTLSIEHHDKLSDLIPTITSSAAGVYDSKDNKIHLRKDINSYTVQNKYDIVAATILIHELCHMASRNYDDKTKKAKVGLSCYPASSPKELNLGLTEGITENLAMSITENWHPEISGYYQEVMIASQLSQIIGKEVLLTSYFENKGITPIENALNGIIDNKEKSSVLFRQIEDAYDLSSYDVPQTYLGSVQSTLVDYFIAKTKKNMIDDFESSYESTEIFEKCLIQPEIIKLRDKNPDNYIGLPESLDKFKSFKDKLTTVRKKLSETNQQESINQAVETESISHGSR